MAVAKRDANHQNKICKRIASVRKLNCVGAKRCLTDENRIICIFLRYRVDSSVTCFTSKCDACDEFYLRFN